MLGSVGGETGQRGTNGHGIRLIANCENYSINEQQSLIFGRINCRVEQDDRKITSGVLNFAEPTRSIYVCPAAPPAPYASNDAAEVTRLLQRQAVLRGDEAQIRGATPRPFSQVKLTTTLR